MSKEPTRTGDERIAELERLLAAERETRSVLIDKVERMGAALSPDAAIFGAAARLEQFVAARTAEAEGNARELAAANRELRKMSEQMEQIVRHRTRALQASEEQLRDRNLELQRLNDTKNEFISIAAHELRTPMMSIVGYLELILEGKFGDLQLALESRLESVLRSSVRLMRLVNQMLNLSQLELGRVEPHRRELELSSLAADVVDELRVVASSKRQEIVFRSTADITISGDRDMLYQVIANIVSNAIRYTERDGKIEVSVDAAPVQEVPGKWVRLRVKDNGVGISKERRERLFSPFTTFCSPAYHSSDDPDSAGLGLQIARGFIELHRGLISVASEEGAGSEFTVLLPQSAA